MIISNDSICRGILYLGLQSSSQSLVAGNQGEP